MRTKKILQNKNYISDTLYRIVLIFLIILVLIIFIFLLDIMEETISLERVFGKHDMER